VLLGSGDREKPLLYYAAAANVANYFFMLRDHPADSTWLSTESTACGSPVLCLNSLLPILTSANPSPTDLANHKGWYLGLRATEQVVTSAITIFGTVTFSTHTPEAPRAGVCTSRLGDARVYNISYLNASSQNGTNNRDELLPPDTGLPPSPVAGMVDINGEDTAFCIGCGSSSSIEAEEPSVPAGSVPTQPKGRVYWYIQR
jgi:type IV pilus assembly protein PilY1